MPQALQNLIRVFGISPEDACAMVTLTPALSVGEQLAGRILPGAPGILTRWSRDWQPAGVIRQEKSGGNPQAADRLLEELFKGAESIHKERILSVDEAFSGLES